MKYLHLSVPFALATTALLPAPASAAPPVLNCGTAAPTPAPTFWPAWERPPETSAEGFDLTGANKRTNIWNSFGEFQSKLGRYVHTGIDINAVNDETGDFAVVAQSGHLFATHTYDQFTCVTTSDCKLYVRTGDFRYIYYYAHLELRPTGEGDMTPDVSAAMRARIETASNFGSGEQDVATYGDTAVTAGEIVSAIAPFDHPSRTHLHFAINDACENFDGLSPLDWLKGTAGPGYEDKEPPVIDGLSLVDAGNDALVDHEDDHCVAALDEDFDVVAEVRDVWDADTPFLGNEHLGSRKSRYTIYNHSTQTVEVPITTWYEFDMVPFRCSGPLRGAACTDPTAEMALTGMGSFVDEVNLFEPDPDFIGPILAHPFAELMYRVQAPFLSDSFGNPPVYFQTMNHEWGVIDPDVASERIQVGMGGLQEGHYQVSVDTFDQAGNGAVRSVFFKIGTPDPRKDLVIRDNPADTGAIPSTLGGNKHYRSPDIRVHLASDNITLLPNDPEWSSPPQKIAVDVGEDYIVYVRVENTGCATIDDFDIKVGAANAALVSTEWETIDTQQQLAAPLAAGDATVFEFPWEPSMGGAHRCLIAAVNSADDPLEDVTVSMGGDIALQDFDQPAAAFVPTDNSVAQRNITVTSSAFSFGNPFGAAVDFAVDFDCNDLPIEAPGAVVTLRVESFGSLGTAWASVPDVQTSFNITNGQYSFTFDRCKVQLPEFTVAANTVVDAWLDVSLPMVMTGTWTADLTARIDGVVRDGISVVHTQ